MKYAATQDWTVHAYDDGSIAWFLGAAAADELHTPPGTVGFSVATGGFADFEACVTANLSLPPTEFDFAGGVLGAWLKDTGFLDNVAGTDGRNPSWRLERIDGPATTVGGDITYFAGGTDLPAGKYRVSYVDGCMKYAGAQDWAVHAYDDGSIAWFLSSSAGDEQETPPGTVGFTVATGGFADFDECVTANAALAPVEFDFAGGPLGVWLKDTGYADNVDGTDGHNPTWELERLGGCN